MLHPLPISETPLCGASWGNGCGGDYAGQENKLTWYPSIDKPWLNYYSEEAINAKLTEGSEYEYILEW